MKSPTAGGTVALVALVATGGMVDRAAKDNELRPTMPSAFLPDVQVGLAMAAGVEMEGLPETEEQEERPVMGEPSLSLCKAIAQRAKSLRVATLGQQGRGGRRAFQEWEGNLDLVDAAQRAVTEEKSSAGALPETLALGEHLVFLVVRVTLGLLSYGQPA